MREVLGPSVGCSDAGTFWSAFLCSHARRGLPGVKLVISDAHEGLKAAIARVLNATWQRCRVHLLRNLPAHAREKEPAGSPPPSLAPSSHRKIQATARTQWRQVADQMRRTLPRLATFMDEADEDVLPYLDFPPAHLVKLHSTNPIERSNGAIKRRTNVVGIFPNEEAVVRMAGAILIGQNEKWAVQRVRYMTLATIAPLSNTQMVTLAASAN